MSTADHIFIFLNILMAALAAWANLRGVSQADPRIRPMYGARVGLAMLYVVGYLVIMLDPGHGIWLTVLRGIGIPTWFVVWVWSPCLVSKIRHRDMMEIQRLRAQLAEKGIV